VKGEAIASYIFLGLGWRYLQDAATGYPVRGEGFVLENIDTVLARLNEFDLQVTLRAATELATVRQELSALPQDARLTPEQAKRLARVMLDLQRTLQAEALGNVAYVVTDKRLDVRKLLGRSSELFAPEVFRQLPPVARYDFTEAGFCVAFERPTAAAFHLLRATEDVLRSYYCAIVRRDRIDPLLWGPMTEVLAKRRNPPPAELLRNLDNIRLSFRNPTQHPDKIYDIQEAQDLFSLCVDVVNRMVRSAAWKGAA